MGEIIIYGAPESTYVWTARMTCIEKGAPHVLRTKGHDRPEALQAPAHTLLHPFAKMPAMRHGDLVLFETSAICRYVDSVFDGPALVPSEPAAAARMEQWISAVNCYIYDDMIRRCVLQYVFPSGPDGAPNRRIIDGAKDGMRRDLRILDAAYDAGDSLGGGEAVTLADLLIAPILYYFGRTPEGEEMLPGAPNVQRAKAALEARASFREAAPPPPAA